MEVEQAARGCRSPRAPSANRRGHGAQTGRARRPAGRDFVRRVGDDGSVEAALRGGLPSRRSPPGRRSRSGTAGSDSSWGCRARRHSQSAPRTLPSAIPRCLVIGRSRSLRHWSPNRHAALGIAAVLEDRDCFTNRVPPNRRLAEKSPSTEGGARPPAIVPAAVAVELERLTPDELAELLEDFADAAAARLTRASIEGGNRLSRGKRSRPRPPSNPDGLQGRMAP